MSPDAELLRRYVRDRDERAFAELVHSHLGLVFSAAVRRTGGRADLAEDICQKVFVELARRAAQLYGHPTVVGWLYQTTRNAAIDVMRAEQTRQRYTEAFGTMPSNDSLPSSDEWERLRPVLDAAMDGLKERDRELMLLRYFNGLSFAEVGAKLDLSENAARMRTERALDKLRTHLERKGIASTSTALGLVLVNKAFAAVPVGLAATVTQAAASVTPASGGVVAILFMSKFISPVISAAIAAGLTAVIWTSTVAGTSAEEMANLRAENARLNQAVGPNVAPAAASAVADEYAAQAGAIVQAMTQRQESQAFRASGVTGVLVVPSGTRAVTARGHSDHGRNTPHDAAMTFAWAGDVSDPDALAKIIYFDPEVRTAAEQILATMPAAIRAQFATPEQFYGLLLAASTTEAPPPGADLLEAFTFVELSPGRVAHRPPGSTVNGHEYQKTADGWKYVLPLAGVKGLPTILNSETLARLAKH